MTGVEVAIHEPSEPAPNQKRLSQSCQNRLYRNFLILSNFDIYTEPSYNKVNKLRNQQQTGGVLSYLKSGIVDNIRKKGTESEERN